MTTEAWIVIVTLFVCVSLLITTRIAAELILFGGVAFLLIIGILTPDLALAGFSNEGVLTIAALYVVASGLKETGAIHYMLNKIMGNENTVRGAHMRIMSPVILMSAFFNNTPIVASFIPALDSRFKNFNPSKLCCHIGWYLDPDWHQHQPDCKRIAHRRRKHTFVDIF